MTVILLQIIKIHYERKEQLNYNFQQNIVYPHRVKKDDEKFVFCLMRMKGRGCIGPVRDLNWRSNL